MVVEGTGDYVAASANKINKNKIQQFNFSGVVEAFDKARAANPKLDAWSVSQALLSCHLAGSDTAALGSDLAYQYARQGNLANVTVDTAQAALASPRFGAVGQALSSGSAASVGGFKLA
jgi:hypothetical protein